MHYALDSSQSFVNWKGFLRSGYFNHGTLPVESTLLRVRDGLPYAGQFEMPLAGLRNINLPEKGLQEMLIRQLQSSAFFHMDRHPVLRFSMSELKPCGGQSDQGTPCRIEGALELMGMRYELGFEALVLAAAQRIAVSGQLRLDLGPWGIGMVHRDDLEDEEIIEREVELEFRLFGMPVKASASCGENNGEEV